MNNQDAIEVLKTLNRDYFCDEFDEANEAILTAIAALETQQADMWIPITEKLPEDRLDVDVTIKEKSNEVGGFRYYTAVAWMQDGRWVFKRSQYEPVIIAWKYRPTPYKEVDECNR